MFSEPKEKDKIRCERKYDLSPNEAELIEYYIYNHPAIFRQAYPPRYVNSIYFDSGDLSCYNANLSGAKNRHKIRLRWYGPMLGKASDPCIEFKIKDGLSGWKVMFPINEFELTEGIDSYRISDYISASNPGEAPMLYIKTVHPVLLIRYRRKYYISSSGKYRITLDSGMEYYIIHSLSNSFINSFGDRYKRILELKYSVKNDNHADSISNYFPFRITKSSKYVSAVKNLRIA